MWRIYGKRVGLGLGLVLQLDWACGRCRQAWVVDQESGHTLHLCLEIIAHPADCTFLPYRSKKLTLLQMSLKVAVHLRCAFSALLLWFDFLYCLLLSFSWNQWPNYYLLFSLFPDAISNSLKQHMLDPLVTRSLQPLFWPCLRNKWIFQIVCMQ